MIFDAKMLPFVKTSSTPVNKFLSFVSSRATKRKASQRRDAFVEAARSKSRGVSRDFFAIANPFGPG